MAYTGKKPVDHTDVTQSQSMTVTDDLTVDTDTLHVDSTNNRVGIGTTSPSHPLHVYNSSAGTVAEFRSNDGTNNPRFSIYGDSSGTHLHHTWSSGASNLIFEVGGSAGSNEKMRITSTGLGIGTTDPRTNLHVSGLTGDDDPALGSSVAPFLVTNTANSYGLNIGVNNQGDAWLQAQSNTTSTAYDILLNPLGGNVGIGTTSPSEELDITGDGSDVKIRMYDGAGASVGRIAHSGANLDISNTATSSATMTFTTGSGSGSEAMRIDSSGNVLVGRTSGSSTTEEAGLVLSSFGYIYSARDGTSTQTHHLFINNAAVNATSVGSIRTSGSTTSYNTTSDYRLKENVADLTGAITRIKNLSPKRFNFTGFTDTVDGFLAHEAQTVVPEAVHGTHNETEAIGDITDADNNPVETGVVEPDTLEDGHTWTATGTQPVYQGIDQSKLVPLLTAALQEAIAKIETLETQNADFETRIAALEAN